MKGNSNSWFPMCIYDKTAGKGVYFGPALQNEKSSYMYPNEKIKMNSTVIWVPSAHQTVSLASYERAHKEQDQEALSKISILGIPLGCTFGKILDLNPA